MGLPRSGHLFIFRYFFKCFYIFIWLHQVLPVACGIFSCIMQALSCSKWDVIVRPGTEHLPTALGAWSLSPWTTREVPIFRYWRKTCMPFYLPPHPCCIPLLLKVWAMDQQQLSSLEMQHLRPHPHLLNQTLHLIKILGDPCVRVKDVYDQQLFLEKK